MSGPISVSQTIIRSLPIQQAPDPRQGTNGQHILCNCGLCARNALNEQRMDFLRYKRDQDKEETGP